MAAVIIIQLKRYWRRDNDQKDTNVDEEGLGLRLVITPQMLYMYDIKCLRENIIGT